jgi:hypothetical protein
MSIFRTVHLLVVDATQCEHAQTVATDTGFCNASKGDWIVRGEGGETYVVDDAFFRRTYSPLPAYPNELEYEDAAMRFADQYRAEQQPLRTHRS